MFMQNIYLIKFFPLSWKTLFQWFLKNSSFKNWTSNLNFFTSSFLFCSSISKVSKHIDWLSVEHCIIAYITERNVFQNENDSFAIYAEHDFIPAKGIVTWLFSCLIWRLLWKANSLNVQHSQEIENHTFTTTTFLPFQKSS